MSSAVLMNCAEKGPYGRAAGKVKEVRWASAIRGTKTDQWSVTRQSARQYPCPLMFALLRIVAVPDRIESRERSKVIDMPVRSNGWSSMVSDPSPQAAGTVGAAHIDVAAGDERKLPQPADHHSGGSR